MCAVAGFVRAQEPVFRTLNQLAGLPSNTVYNLMEDEQGFIWVAHTRGVSRYDGKNFQHYVTPGDQGKAVSNLMRFKQATWCQDFSGRFFFTQGDSLIEEKRVRFSGNYLNAGILGERSLAYYFVNRLVLLDLLSGKEEQYFIPHSNSTFVTADKKSYLITTVNGIYRTEGGAPVLTPFPNMSMPGIIVTTQIDDRLLMVKKNESGELYELSNNTIQVHRFLPSGISIHNLDVIDDQIWVATSGGAYLFTKDLRPLNNGRPFFNGVNVNQVLKDREGNFWFSTLNKGIYVVPNLQFRLYTYQGASISALAVDSFRNKIYAGTENNQLLEFTPNQQFELRYNHPVNHEINSIHLLSQSGFFLMSDQFRWLDLNFQLKLERQLAVKQVAELNPELYAIAFTGGVDVYDFSPSGTAIPKWLQFYQKDLMPHRRVGLFPRSVRGRSVCFKPADSTLYASTAAGLYYFSPRGKGEIKLNQQPIVANDITRSGDWILASTFSQGLLRITDSVATPLLNKENGLRSNTIYKIRMLNQVCWFLQDGVVGRFDLNTRKLTLIDNSYGLPKSDLLDMVVTANQVYVATSEGLVLFNPSEIRRDFAAPKFFINEFLVNGEKLHYENGIKLSESSNNIELNFSVLSYRQQDILQVKYRINKGNWSTLAPSVRTLQLPALESGDYQIELAICDLDGTTLSQPDPIRFQIATPWYRNVWFWVVALLTVAFFSNLYFRQRIRLLNQSNKLAQEKLLLEQEVQKSRLASIKSQMNPHFIFNALNTIQAYIYTNNQEKAAGYLQKFSELTRRILNMSNTDTVPLREEIRALTLYLDLEQQRFEEPVEVHWDIDPRLDIDIIHIPSMLIQPYVENAIKHGLLHRKGKKELYLRFNSRGDNLEIQVDDNGVGRKRAASLKGNRSEIHQSFAVSANKKRLDILNQGRKNPIVMAIIDKYSETQEPMGTRVTLSIPRFSSTNS